MERLIAGAKKLGIELNEKQLEQFQTYYEELTDWNQRMNLTSITECEDVQIKHFLDSLTILLASPQLCVPGTKVIDIGTGAGLPGIPLKIVLPEIKLTLLEATAKKTTFLQHLKEKLALSDVEIVVGRAEDAGHRAEYREKFDIALARSVAPLPVLVELALPFCKTGGCLIAQKKGEIEQEVNQAAKAIETLGGRLKEIKNIDLPEFPDDRCLVVVEKAAPTPEKYPRRAGIPAKRPIT